MRIVCLVLLFLTATATYAANDNIIGTWKLRSAQGERANQIPPSLSYTFNADLTCVMAYQAKDGSINKSQWTYEIRDHTVLMRLVGSKKLAEVSTITIIGSTLTMKNRQESIPIMVFDKAE